MTNLFEMLTKALLLLLIFTNLLAIFVTFAKAVEMEPDVYDLWNTLEEFEATSSLQDLLVENNWASSNVTVDDLDYILVMVQQIHQTCFPNVPVALVLATISLESSFQKDLEGFSNDSGLMQVIPKWHEDRIAKYAYDEKVDIFDPRLNILVGMDYLNELLTEAEGDVAKALMMYNEGPQKGSRHYTRSGESLYATEVCYRMDIISEFLERRAYGEEEEAATATR